MYIPVIALDGLMLAIVVVHTVLGWQKIVKNHVEDVVSMLTVMEFHSVLGKIRLDI